MKNHLALALKILLLLIVCVGIFYGMNELFDRSALFRSLFCGPNADAVIGEIEPGSGGATLAMRDEVAGRVAMFIFAGISILQVVVLFVAAIVIGRIRKSDMSPALKLKQLENSEIFLDVPLYIGLFGTVSSFLVMTYSPTSSRLIAYSSTMIGIIFSLCLRLALNYPLRRKLIMQKSGEK